MATLGKKRVRAVRRHLSLATEHLVLQLLIIAVVMAGVIAVSVDQATNDFERSESRRSLSAAESLAANPMLRALLPEAAPEMGAALPAMAESTRSISGLEFVAVADAEGKIITSSYPQDIGKSLINSETNVLEGRAWRGEVKRENERILLAQVPVLNDKGQLIGVVEAGQSYPHTIEIFRVVAPNALITLLICLLLGAGGSFLLSRRVKYQTRGLEPREITELFEHREALLHGVKEGIISIGPDQHVTLANDVAIDLLNLPLDCVGRTLKELNVQPSVIRALMTEQPEPDREFLIDEKVVVFNRMPLHSRGTDMGSVTTFRDRTELTLLEQELGDTKATSDMLRAQTHEFANQLHTISGLIQLEEYDDVIRFIDGVSFSRSKTLEEITQRILEPTIAALLIAKASVIAERGMELILASDSWLPRCEDSMAKDLTTVIGNLIDNAMDAVAESEIAKINLRIDTAEEHVTITVKDSGPGLDPEVIEEIFTQGFSTKTVQKDRKRGFGLALSRLVCRRRGGDILAENDHGAKFVATLAQFKKEDSA
ncbi:ATPase [Glutamicibacter uratoxydans]|uniref:histidine kinase n=1 Tax=Glutamicibacter uratoxydans TaxID=43667 RepID=A0A4Y4DPN7_GLUUR|nr:sensor histidine kinase [Glutamicibacter uratoxydans]GED06583.1 ATPase [Glutamicibacter uratoxydans]